MMPSQQVPVATLMLVALALVAAAQGAGAPRVSGLRAASPAVGQAAPSQAPPSVLPAALQRRALLDKYCIACHNERRLVAGLMLDKIDTEDVGGGAEIWEKVVRKLRTGEMPPRGMPRPDQGTYDSWASSLETALDRTALVNPNPGRVPLHRLNRTEYANAIRDLLALEVDGRSLLPADDRDQEGFDNIAGALSISPVLMERYMAAARTVSRQAVGDSTLIPVFDTYKIPSGVVQPDRMSEDLPFGSRAGIAIRHHFPLDGEYVVKLRLRRQIYYYIIGMGFPHQLEVRLDGERVKLFTVGGEAKGRPAPASLTGNILGDPEWEQYMHTADAGLEIRLPVKAGTRVVGVSFLDTPLVDEGVLQAPQTGIDYDSSRNEHYDGKPSLESVAIGGPYNPPGPGDTPSRRRIFVCRPTQSAGEEPCARRILSTLARRAYRRPVVPEDLSTLLSFYKAGQSGGSFDAGIQRGIERMLADPDFLFRAERDPEKLPPATPYRLNDFELASRLSFFLWSSIPDDMLLDIAGRGKLSDPTVLEQQVRRMMADPRSEALVDNFADQWLKVRELSGVTPDPEMFTEFNDNLREAFRQETKLFLGSQLREDRSVVDLLTANYTFLNEQLAQHYGIPDVYGSHFRRVRLTDGRRQGLLGHGSILTVTAYPNRTSPVLRGKWLLDNILGSPPPAPPPDVPSLEENRADGPPRSVRERMEAHRKNVVCASCHVRMDPLGFALENFDAVGRWRTTSETGAPIDVSGALPTGVQFDGVEGLRKLLVSHRDEFIGTFAAKLLTYAIGRTVEHYDQPAIRRIRREASAGGYRWSSIIVAVVKSTPFQMRRSES